MQTPQCEEKGRGVTLEGVKEFLILGQVQGTSHDFHRKELRLF
jgi:hypothetical protein